MTMLQTLAKRTRMLPRAVIVLIGVVLAFVVGVADYYTGYEITLSIFYILPVIFVAWFGTRAAAVLLSVLCAVIWIASDLTSGHEFSSFVIAAWNTGVILAFFLFIAVSMSKIRTMLAYERELARTDFLTGMFNSRAFTEIASIEIERSNRYGHPFTLVYIDIDDFKVANDTLGHSAGDRLLYDVARALRDNLRSSDILARLGGDEFALLMPETDEARARVAIAKAQLVLTELARTNDWPVTFSIGSATCRTVCALDELIREADRLMYIAKSRGKNRAEFKTVEMPPEDDAERPLQ